MATTMTSIAYDEFFPHPIERVWGALTDPAAVAKWLMPNDFKPTVGHRFNFHTQPVPPQFDGIVHCEVTVVDPPQCLAYTWGGGGISTVVTYRLATEQRDGVTGTHLYFEHAGFDLSRPSDQGAYNGMAGGWRHLVGPGLLAILDERAAAGL